MTCDTRLNDAMTQMLQSAFWCKLNVSNGKLHIQYPYNSMNSFKPGE